MLHLYNVGSILQELPLSNLKLVATEETYNKKCHTTRYHLLLLFKKGNRTYLILITQYKLHQYIESIQYKYYIATMPIKEITRRLNAPDQDISQPVNHPNQPPTIVANKQKAPYTISLQKTWFQL